MCNNEPPLLYPNENLSKKPSDGFIVAEFFYNKVLFFESLIFYEDDFNNEKALFKGPFHLLENFLT